MQLPLKDPYPSEYIYIAGKGASDDIPYKLTGEVDRVFFSFSFPCSFFPACDHIFLCAQINGSCTGKRRYHTWGYSLFFKLPSRQYCSRL